MHTDRTLLAALLLASLPLSAACGASADDAGAASSEDALSPAGGFNHAFEEHSPGVASPQNRDYDRVCVGIHGDAIALRYGDGTPIPGIVMRRDQLEYAPHGHGPGETENPTCPSGHLRLDVRDIIDTKDGKRLVFHRGDAGYRDPNGAAYGFVDIADLTGVPHFRGVSAVGNGAACAPSKDPSIAGPYTLRVKPLDDLGYRTGNGGSIGFSMYGDPIGHKGRFPLAASDKYSLLSMSWVSDAAGRTLPAGGMARAILREGTLFYRCDVRAIRTPDVNGRGWVEAVYVGALIGEDPTFIYGWLPFQSQLDGVTQSLFERVETPHTPNAGTGGNPGSIPTEPCEIRCCDGTLQNGGRAMSAQECIDHGALCNAHGHSARIAFGAARVFDRTCH